ncbi:MAG: hypothetical protein IPP59_03540 [Betaproteobacteria bacterium]|nr:hypothetical protein [Candidatus Dechloromonas phosphorivorans]
MRGQEANGFFIDRQLTGNELLVINALVAISKARLVCNVNFLLNPLVAVDFARKSSDPEPAQSAPGPKPATFLHAASWVYLQRD